MPLYLMDFNPLDILASAALGEKGVPQTNSSKLSKGSGCGEAPNSEASESKDADDESDSDDMGKSTDNDLKDSSEIKSSCTEKKMAPQKLSWNPEDFLSGGLDTAPEKRGGFILDELKKDVKEKDIDSLRHADNSAGNVDTEDTNMNEKGDSADVMDCMTSHQNNNVLKTNCEQSLSVHSSGSSFPSVDSQDEKDLIQIATDTVEGKDNFTLSEKALEMCDESGVSSPEKNQSISSAVDAVGYSNIDPSEKDLIQSPPRTIEGNDIGSPEKDLIQSRSDMVEGNEDTCTSSAESMMKSDYGDTQSDPADNSSQSDTDTADTSDGKPTTLLDLGEETSCLETVSLDHPYALIPGQLRSTASMDNYDEDDDIDVCSSGSPLTEEMEQRSRNLSLDCVYLKSGIMEGVSASTIDLYKCSSSSLFRSKLPSASSTPSPTVSSYPTPPHSEAACEPLNSAFKQVSPFSSDKNTAKCGKFKIGTFASFSSSNLELEKYLRNKESNNGRKLNIGPLSETSLINPPLNSPSSLPSHSMLQSPGFDWDRSEASSETQDDSSDARTPHRLTPDFTIERATEWTHPMYHDHDYCGKSLDTKLPTPDDLSQLNTGKRKYVKRKNKVDGANHDKIMKAKYLKKELLKQDNFLKSKPLSDVEPVSYLSEPVLIKPNPVGRPRKRPLEKGLEDEIDPETGTKMKITGKFQDQYVYYLSKSSRSTSRRRQSPALPFPSDKIIVPAPKPGDIIVPHLTDADIETVRLKGRSALNIPERPNVTSTLSVPSSSHCQTVESIGDVDSHIVSTILSMENDNLASPSTSQPSDISNSSELNPNQPALTESLRMMSGDSSITAEHMLNYLLSVVKDDVHSEQDALLGPVSAFDTSSSTLFPSLPSDSIYTKVEHPGESDGVLRNEPTVNTANEDEPHEKSRESEVTSLNQSSNEEMLNTSTKEVTMGSNSRPLNVIKSDIDDQVGLTDDLSSLISHSQGTTTSTISQGDSLSSVKSLFGPDLGTVGGSQLAPTVPHLTSIEKTLDYLGVKDGDIKFENHQQPVFDTKMEQDNESSLLTPMSEDDTPWIVTVTLYFNDVPAIMVNSQPFIRLVDIHKQILPAKDTGILKKRCQLLNIPVLNCTEMQRYFLVQYGRAYNSKSTLIVSKEQATALVTYYATPQPRMGRLEEPHSRRLGSVGSGDGSSMSPVHSPTPAAPIQSKKRGTYRTVKKAPLVNGLPVDESSVEGSSRPSEKSPIPEGDPTSPHNKRTRHKKINYLEMLKGEEKDKSADSILETIESVVKSAPEHMKEYKSNKAKHLQNSSKSPSKKRVKNNVNCDMKIKSDLKNKKQSGILKTKKSKEGSGSTKEKMDSSSPLKGKGSSVKSSKSDRHQEKKNVEIGFDADSDDSTGLSPRTKYRPLKLKVNSLFNFAAQRKGSTSPCKSSSPCKKGGLFSRSNSSGSAASAEPLRVLAVAHQAALSNDNNETRLPSQPADIHLDLFTKSNSACVRCHTCSQFLSVPHFMQHHHVPMDNEWLATEAAQRVLVPRNKENISDAEKKLWEEFHRLQEAIGGFGEMDDDSDSGEEEEDDEEEDHDDQSSLELSGASSSLLSLGRSSPSLDSSEKGSDVPQVSFTNEDSRILKGSESHSSSLCTPNSANQALDHLSKNSGSVVNDVKEEERFTTHSGLPNGFSSVNHSNVRTSSRKRKSKQLFSIENYYTPKKTWGESDPSSIPSSSDLNYSNGISLSSGINQPLPVMGLDSLKQRLSM